MRIRIPTFLLCCLLAWSPEATAQLPTSLIDVSDYPACLKPGNSPVEVQFSADAVGVTDWWWDFGNDQQSTEPRPLAEYDAPGSFDVTLTVHTGRHGSTTIVEDNLIQINWQVFEDDFEDPARSAARWQNLDPSLIVNSALEFEVKILPEQHDQQSGEIICLNGGGEGPPVSSSRFFFDLELIAEDPRFVAFTAFRLLDGSPPAQVLASLRVQRVDKRFEIRIEGPNGIVPFHPLVQQNPVLTVGFDWFLEAGVGDLTVEVQENSEPAVIQHLPLGTQPGFHTVQLGVIDLDWPDVGTRAGRMRVDNFRSCNYDYRPDP